MDNEPKQRTISVTNMAYDFLKTESDGRPIKQTVDKLIKFYLNNSKAGQELSKRTSL